MNVPAKGSKRRLAFVLLLVVWVLKFIFGFIAATGRHALGYPDAVRGFPSPYMGDIEYYVIIPAVFVVLNLLMAIFASRLPNWLVIIFTALQIFSLLAILFFSTGGV